MSQLKKRIQTIIRQNLLEDVEKEENMGTIVNPIDHAKAVGSEAVTDEPEVIDHASGKVVKMSDRVFSLSESNLRKVIRTTLSKAMGTQ